MNCNLSSRWLMPNTKPQRQENFKMALKRSEDSFGDPIEYAAGWQWSGHSSRSDAEKDELARAALEAVCKQEVLKKRANGRDLQFDHVQLVRNENLHSSTHKNPFTGETTASASGTGVGYMFYTIP